MFENRETSRMPGSSEQEQAAVGGQEGKSVREGLGCVPGGVG